MRNRNDRTLAGDSGRIPFFDFLKGAAILWVVWIHVVDQVPRDAPFRWMYLVTDLWGRFAVPAFFILVGYMYMEKYAKEPARKTGGRILRVLLPYLSASAAYAATGYLFDLDFRQTGNLLLDVLLGYSSYQLYFLVAYLSFFAVVPLLNRFRMAERSCGWLWAAILGHLLLLVLWERQIVRQGEAGPFLFYSVTDHRAFWNWLGFIAFGMLLAKVRPQLQPRLEGPDRRLSLGVTPALILYSFLSPAYVLAGRQTLIYESAALYVFTLTALVLLRALFLSQRGKTWVRGVEWMGRRSLSLYLIHVWLLEVLLLFVPGAWLYAPPFYPVLFLAVMALWYAVHQGVSLMIRKGKMII